YRGRYILAALGACQLTASQLTELYEDTGLLAEYFAPLPVEQTCGAVNGSTSVFENLMPSITRRVTNINFPDRDSFKLDRCAWETDGMARLKYTCRGQEEILKNFAARFTGEIFISSPGYYEFYLYSEDGARLVLGHN
ncbi:unnamed protein product, partial [Polarella glacialis]